MQSDDRAERARLTASVADKIEASMGPLVGSPEYLADPIKRARSEKRRREGAEFYAQLAVDQVHATIIALTARVAELEGAVAGEREACARVADDQAQHAMRLVKEDMTDARVTVLMASERVAAAIRQRKEVAK